MKDVEDSSSAKGKAGLQDEGREERTQTDLLVSSGGQRRVFSSRSLAVAATATPARESGRVSSESFRKASSTFTTSTRRAPRNQSTPPSLNTPPSIIMCVDSEEDKALLLSSRLLREEKNYWSLVDRMEGSRVVIGSEIVLQHVDSSEFLSGTHSCPDSPIDAFKIKIMPSLSSMNLFKIIAANSFDLDGDSIMFG